jgi:hypothetical protein
MTSDLAVRAKREREIVNSPEAQALQKAICKAVQAYSDFLDRHGLIWWDSDDGERPRMMAQALVITADYGADYGTIDFTLKDGALDKLYGDGTDPDPGDDPLVRNSPLDDTPARKH